MEDKAKLLILYASQTGNAMDAAERLGREGSTEAARRRPFHRRVWRRKSQTFSTDN